ncbi:hypothetical protein [Corynebacterium bovis]|uniref:Uncharacterized protein n=3 Tax=Corynebacterium bovis TaxID=36808 RepID=A0A8H9YDP8_9CORY|nr:hypothetical protein [Corynebacterium bovis]MBB3116724.1 hypothetical protein [Corynebacterium bovis DSM 20582 = CIP 54.80]QQC47271.1 hypothetical protein I6I09_09595 [Corynebacterium bovis]RRO81500.1 hypothetical protein CXF38_03735 [Corynebacterium bovis]RRQ14736.1 hypothetical protein CXF47_03120 [Corynebacterium bovis]RRQ17007.1 hypothetical protein CXF46_03175 [Corynebacterium bovis]
MSILGTMLVLGVAATGAAAAWAAHDRWASPPSRPPTRAGRVPGPGTVGTGGPSGAPGTVGTVGAVGTGVDIVWFHVHGPGTPSGSSPSAPTAPGTPSGSAGPPPGVLDLDVLAASLRIPRDDLRAAEVPLPRPRTPAARTYAGLAAMLGPSVRTVVGVPGAVAQRMPWAAAAAGVIAVQLGEEDDAAPPRLPSLTGPDAPATPRRVPVHPVPGWIIGTDVHGAALTVPLAPGTTVLLTGPAAELHVRTLPVSGRRCVDVTDRPPATDATAPAAGHTIRRDAEAGSGDGPSEGLGVTGVSPDDAAAPADVVVIRVPAGAPDWVPVWRRAWHPQSCRLLVLADTHPAPTTHTPGIATAHPGTTTATGTPTGPLPATAPPDAATARPDVVTGHPLVGPAVDMVIDTAGTLVTGTPPRAVVTSFQPLPLR